MYIIFKAMEVNKSMLVGCSYSPEKVEGEKRDPQITNTEDMAQRQKSPREAPMEQGTPGKRWYRRKQGRRASRRRM